MLKQRYFVSTSCLQRYRYPIQVTIELCYALQFEVDVLSDYLRSVPLLCILVFCSALCSLVALQGSAAYITF